MPKSVDLPQNNKTHWTLVRGLVKGYGGFRKQSKLYTDHEQYLLGITNDQLYGHDIEVSESLEATLSVNDAFEPFQSHFEPKEMRCLALIAHNHMKPAMKAFVEHRKELLKKFRLTGTKTTMTMLKTVFGEDTNETHIFVLLNHKNFVFDEKLKKFFSNYFPQILTVEKKQLIWILN